MGNVKRKLPPNERREVGQRGKKTNETKEEEKNPKASYDYDDAVVNKKKKVISRVNNEKLRDDK